jgi:type 2 lantibiotic biosynthesis protein LanM
MDAFYERLIGRAATIDERLSHDFEPLPGRKDDAELAARRLAAWCSAAANGDWGLFGRRLDRDGLSYGEALARLATISRNASAPPPAWIDDAAWIEASLQSVAGEDRTAIASIEPVAFQHLLLPLVAQAESRLWTEAGPGPSGHLTPSACSALSAMLLGALSDLCAPALYERFARMRDAQPGEASYPASGTQRYGGFVADMRAGGLRQVFEESPVLLRLIASLTRQWIDFVHEFVRRLDADLGSLRGSLLPDGAASRVTRIDGDLSDRHNGGRSVLILTFEDGAKIAYKPKDLRLDVAWFDLIARLNGAAPPVDLRAVRALARDHYGWTEFIAHIGCDDEGGCAMFFRRAGAFLALLHCCCATDMHQENVIAWGDHPVPIDLETILQPPASVPKTHEAHGAAYDAAADMIVNSVMAVGMLPAYGRAPDTSVFAMGAMTADWNSRIKLAWTDINTDRMRPAKTKVIDSTNPNLPHVDGRYARFTDHFEIFLAGFEDYARFLSERTRGANLGGLLDGFAGAPVRKVVRPTRFYSMLLQRLKNHRSMDDGAVWSAQADFIARMSDWDTASDAAWPFLHSERSALLSLNVPHFVVPSDGHDTRDAAGVVARSAAETGLDRARARVQDFDAREIAWQVEVIRANTAPAKPAGSADSAAFVARTRAPAAATPELFLAEAGRIAEGLSEHAIRRGSEAAWIGLDWLGDAEAFQLVCLGPDLYNGVSGIAVFLSAHAAVARHEPSAMLARAAVSHLRRKLKDGNAARFARSLGIGGAVGLGSLVYALTVMSKTLRDDGLLADAQAAADLMTDDLIAADRRLDVIGGSAGAILGLLRLYRDTKSDGVLARAVTCGEHLLRQNRIGPEGRRSWVGLGFGQHPLNGMSHGAAGFAYALASLAAATGREDFAQAASACLAFENASYDADRHNWPDLRHPGAPGWACRWCHGAPGIGLARAAMLKRGMMDPAPLRTDIGHALEGVEQGWPQELDTLCCGTLGSVEFFCEAGDALGRPDVRAIAAERLSAMVAAAASAGDFRWNSGKRQFNLGLFRGVAGVGYTLLRQVDGTLPNVLVWE